MTINSERLPCESGVSLKEGEKKVKLVFSSAHSFPKAGDFSLFNDIMGEEDGDLEEMVLDGEDRDTGKTEEKSPENGKKPRLDIPPEELEALQQGKMNARLQRRLERFLEEAIPTVGEEEDKYILRCEGVLFQRDGGYVIRYQETDDSGLTDTQSELILPGDRRDMVTISRSGGVMNTLICEKGVRHLSAYRTPLMLFELSVFSRECMFTLDPDRGGDVFLDYFVELRGMEMQHTRMRVNVRVLS